MRAASRIMEKECNGKWKAETIRHNFENWTGPNLAHRAKGTGQNEIIFLFDMAREKMLINSIMF
jgi:hypothetical protein